ncbi:MAG: hypothetical protein E6J90_23090 [Deltaproteobacteria bacterium]|nr:MAG: hypothetical protein E6J90_23090 [Deltaproteobacteria bacterium]
MDPRAAARGLAGLPPFSALPDTFGDTVGFAAGSGFAAGDTLDQFGEGTERSASVGFGAQFGFASGARGTRPGTQSEDRPGAARLNAPASPRILLSLLIAVALVMIAALARWVVH